MERSFPPLVGPIGVERYLPLSILQQINDELKMIIFDCHHKDIILLSSQSLHIGTIPLQKLDHLDIAVKRSKMKRSQSILVLNINPSFQLVLERRIISRVLQILLRKRLEMQHINFKFLQFVFESSKVDERRIIFLSHESEVQLRPVLQETAQVVVALDIHDRGNGPVVLLRLLFAIRHDISLYLIEYCSSTS